MLRHVLAAALAATSLVGTAWAADNGGAKCSGGSLCPEDTPCCGLYGDCGLGAFCVQGADPAGSYKLEAGLPNPQCKSTTYNLNSLDDIQSIDKYLGDASKINWVSQGKPVVYDDSILLTMAEGTVGTLLSSTHYVWYGKICAKATTSQGKGVVTAFIMMSDIKDEIDFEFIGVDVEHGQSNYYSQGVTVYTNSANLTVGGNTAEDFHDYCVDWKPDSLTWSIDGKDLRTVERKETWNSTSGRFDFPQTPSRIMLSLWPAGLASNAKGTIDWAGGEIDWNSQYMQNGYYFARFKEVSVECYDPPSGHKGNGKKSYKYTDRKGTNDTIELSDDLVVLGSLYASGLDPEEGATTASNAPKPTKSVALVPGGNPGAGNNNGGDDVATSGSNPSATGSGAGASPTSNDGTGSTDFQQNDGGSQGAGSSLQPGLGKVGGGAIAIVVALLGLIAL